MDLQLDGQASNCSCVIEGCSPKIQVSVTQIRNHGESTWDLEIILSYTHADFEVIDPLLLGMLNRKESPTLEILGKRDANPEIAVTFSLPFPSLTVLEEVCVQARRLVSHSVRRTLCKEIRTTGRSYVQPADVENFLNHYCDVRERNILVIVKDAEDSRKNVRYFGIHSFTLQNHKQI